MSRTRSIALLMIGLVSALVPACTPDPTPGDPGQTTSTTQAVTTTTTAEPPRTFTFGELPAPISGGGPVTTTTIGVPPSPPPSADLTASAGPARDQKNVGACNSFAIAHLMRWKMHNAGFGIVDFAPMYLFSQTHTYDVAHDTEGGSSFVDALEIVKTQGIAPASSYFQGDHNWRDLPTAAQRAAASDYRIQGYTNVFHAGPDKALYIKDAIAKGSPVLISFVPTDGVMDLISRHQPTDIVTDTTNFTRNPGQAGHLVVALGYDSTGLVIQNSWGPGWGYSSGSASGLGKLSWGFVNSDLVRGAATVGGLIVNGTPVPPDAPAATEVTAVSPSPGASASYVVDASGGTWGNYFSPIVNQWSGWFSLAPSAKFPGARITAVPDGTGAVDLTVQAAETGEIYHGRHQPGLDNRGTPGQPAELNRWTGWGRMTHTTTPPGGSPVTVLDRAFPFGREIVGVSARPGETSLYVQDADGRIWSQYRAAGGSGWSEWFALGSKSFPDGSHIAAVSPAVGETSLYVLDGFGTTWQDVFPAGGSAWSNWFAVDTGVLPTLPFFPSDVTAISVRPGETSLYAVAVDGRVHTTFFPAGGSSWSGWVPLGSNTFPVGSTVAATSSGPGVTGLYLLGTDGQVWSQFFDPNGGAAWSGWFGLGGTFPPNDEVSAFSTQPGGTTLHVRDIGGYDRSTYFAPGATAWAPWFKLN